MIWYQLLIAVGIGMIGVMASVTLGGWLVFKAETITMPSTFIGQIKRKGQKAGSYMPDDFGIEDVQKHVLDEELSPAAARLRDQKAGPQEAMDKKSAMSLIRGKK